ncbi:hypothetical protein THASP1DRAFT_27770 [Thamnocephalis sphaerospora]|uniref:REJ domain-containing protein n=1 Tax=Thamnocephalis sphaerospora TaxID=78915 RepID=A0A4P9XVX1_9FUNG|nr:hypothetical protein THASP1DRAFT_27770 [Thamnocephalis sphaerospora]|eukprot:RKP10443.1 hypothetical protein THASP1DRAFT_27770 [Thamnocephalis sphaerospora]
MYSTRRLVYFAALALLVSSTVVAQTSIDDEVLLPSTSASTTSGTLPATSGSTSANATVPTSANTTATSHTSSSTSTSTSSTSTTSSSTTSTKSTPTEEPTDSSAGGLEVQNYQGALAAGLAMVVALPAAARLL